MSSSDLALRVSGLSKAYTIRHQAEQHITLAEQALSRLRHPFRSGERETFWALRDVDLEIRKGEVMGIIGRNGAGKSTLLKVLSRITAPTTGRVELYGRLGSLLEVGTGFHPELTGRENIYLNGTILGMKRAEIDRRFDEIVDFAGVSQFLDTPVKRYSSGMYVRLAFAVAAHLDTEILVIDEVLAVGDAEFQDRCLGKMREVGEDGRTVLLVSHNMDAVQRLAPRSVLLKRGNLAASGRTDHVVSRYAEDKALASVSIADHRRGGTGEFRVVEAGLSRDSFRCDEPAVLNLAIDRQAGSLERYYITVEVFDATRRLVSRCDSRLHVPWIFHALDRTQLRCEFEIRSPWLRPGDYEIDLYVRNHGSLDEVSPAAVLRIKDELPYIESPGDEPLQGLTVLTDHGFRMIEPSRGEP